MTNQICGWMNESFNSNHLNRTSIHDHKIIDCVPITRAWLDELIDETIFHWISSYWTASNNLLLVAYWTHLIVNMHLWSVSVTYRWRIHKIRLKWTLNESGILIVVPWWCSQVPFYHGIAIVMSQFVLLSATVSLSVCKYTTNCVIVRLCQMFLVYLEDSEYLSNVETTISYQQCHVTRGF